MGRIDKPLNDPHEAYTGNHIGHRERGDLPKHDTASLIYKADGDVIHSTEAETKDSSKARIWRVSRCRSKGVACMKRSAMEPGRP